MTRFTQLPKSRNSKYAYLTVMYKKTEKCVVEMNNVT